MEFDAAQARRNITIRFVEKDFSRFSVYPIVISYILDILHLDNILQGVLKQKRENTTFSSTEYLLYLFTIIFLGIRHLYKADDVLADEESLAKIMGFHEGKFPTSRSLYLLLKQATYWEAQRLALANRKLLTQKRRVFSKQRWINIDIDQTKKLTEGKSIEKAKPCFSKEKKGKLGLRISASVVEGLVCSQKLEPGNVGNADCFEEILTATLATIDTMSDPIRSKRVKYKKIILRIDGGYFSTKALNFLEGIRAKRRLDFVVRAKQDLVSLREARKKEKDTHWQQIDENTKVLRLSHIKVLEDVEHTYTVVIVEEKQRRIVSKNKRVREKLVAIEYPLVTTLTSWGSKRIIKYYKKRQVIEDIFKDFNQSFHAEKLPSHTFWGNAFYYQMVSIVSNVSVFFKGSTLYRKLEESHHRDLARQVFNPSRRNTHKTTSY